MFNIFKKNPAGAKVVAEAASIVGSDVNARIAKNMQNVASQTSGTFIKASQSFGDIDMLNQSFMKSNQELMQQANEYLQRTQKMMK